MNKILVRVVLGLAGLALVSGARAQVTIGARDFFNEPGLYYRAFSNDPSVPYPVEGLIGQEGANRFWDFSSGPMEEVFRFDYGEVTVENFALDYPSATLWERKTEEGSGKQAWLLFDQVERLGRKVYGFVDPGFSETQPVHVFIPPIVDFPSNIRYGDTLPPVSTTYTTEIIGIPAIVTHSTAAQVDAYGLIDLPELGFGDCLRIDEQVTISVAVDLFGEGNFQNVSTDFVRNYYWLQPGRGIVAQMTSQQSANPVPEAFTLATAFVRMFETNKEAVSACDSADPVTDLTMSMGQGRVLLRWTETDCTSAYRVEFNDAVDPEGWSVLGETTDAFYLDVSATQAAQRFYRIISVK